LHCGNRRKTRASERSKGPAITSAADAPPGKRNEIHTIRKSLTAGAAKHDRRYATNTTQSVRSSRLKFALSIFMIALDGEVFGRAGLPPVNGCHQYW
jgi:hypothetical protein